MSLNKKRVCHYGVKCYRKNKKHFEEFSHPAGDSGNEPELDVREDALDTNATKYQCKPKNKPDIVLKKNDPKNSQRRKRTGSSSKDDVEENDENIKNQKKMKGIKDFNVESTGKSQVKDNIEENNSDSCEDDCDKESNTDVKSDSWTFIKVPGEVNSTVRNVEEMSKEELIKFYYLVDMPSDFYSFFQFCKTVNLNDPSSILQPFGLQLLGPYDVLSGKVTQLNNKELMLCHWRYYYDPPEFQTVLAKDNGYHIGYWRDEPKNFPVFMASNNALDNCIFKVESENIFGAVYNYLTEFMKKCDPFSKTKASKLQTNLKKWAEDHAFTLDKDTPSIKKRQKSVNSKTFHRAGIVVPVGKSDVGYRPLIETDANIKKICKLIMEADTEDETETLMENLQPLVNAANIANDECDFGNSLELGIDLFCMGSPIFHNIIRHLLTTAYSLLNRTEYEEIIKAHLGNRRKGTDLSTV